VRLEPIRPGRPMDNGYIESFNGKMREECMNENSFTDLADAGRKSKPGAWTTTPGGRTRRGATKPRPGSLGPAPVCEARNPLRSYERRGQVSVMRLRSASELLCTGCWRGEGGPPLLHGEVRIRRLR
jgi:transposase InsO family protein